MDEYEKHSKSQDSDVELKISKLGEVLVRIVVNLGKLNVVALNQADILIYFQYLGLVDSEA